MMDRLRNRDLRNSINKCYSIYFDDDSKCGNRAATGRKAKSKSPRKRDLYKDNCENEPSPTKAHDQSVPEIGTDIVDDDAASDLCIPNTELQKETNGLLLAAEKPATEKMLEDNNNQNEMDGDATENPRKRRLSCSSDTSVGAHIANSKKMRADSLKEQMFQVYQPWVIKTYGDLAKTKTITIKKHQRILKALSGREQNRPDSSKFRFWVKAKGFTTDKPLHFKEVPVFEPNKTSNAINTPSNDDDVPIHLYIPNLAKEVGMQPYRKVAVVEQFFDIIYNVHVGLGGRSGRHAGQKRTYRTITESYAFLPRDAVTKFLAGCNICKKSPRACSPSRLDDTYCTESSSELDILNYSPKSLCETMPIEASTGTSINTTATIQSDVENGSMEPSHNKTNEYAAGGLSTIDWEEEIAGKSNKTQSTIQNSNDAIVIRDTLATTTTTNTNCSPIATANLAIARKSSIEGRRGKMAHSLDSNAGITYYHDIYSALGDFYRGQTGNKMDAKDATVNNDLLSYYQLVRQFYEQSIGVNTLKVVDNKVDAQSASNSTKTTTVQQEDNATESTSTKSKSAPVNGTSTDTNRDSKPKESAPIILGTSFCIKPDETINFTKSNKTQRSSKTTPPKKRYSEYNFIEDVPKSDVSKVNLNTRFDVATLVPECVNKLNGVTDDEGRLLTTIKIDSDTQRDKASPAGSNDSAVSMTDVKPITSTYLQLMRSMGLTDEDALKFDNLEPISALGEGMSEQQHIDDAYAGLIKDADKLKLMLLAWNYQNSNSVRNGTEGPDLGMVGGLWSQYQNALAVTTGVKLPSASPPQIEQSMNSPSMENPDETSSSGQKDDDDVSEDDSDDRLDQNAHDPERLKAFNMFVRLFVDENLDRMIPISKQPKEKIQAIIDSCTRQFPEFAERARKRIRTYLKSCRRNKKTREGWETTSRPTPAHLTSVQAEQILAMACENESMNAKRMRIGLDPISQSAPATTVNSTSDSTANSISYPLGFKTEPDPIQTAARASPPKTTLNTSVTTDTKPLLLGLGSTLSNGNAGLNNTSLYRQDISSPIYTSRAQQYQNYFTNVASNTVANSNASPTDLSMKQQPSTQTTPNPIQSGQQGQQPAQRPPLLSHKLNSSEITAVRQLVTGYRESAAFLLRSADELETLLLNQNMN